MRVKMMNVKYRECVAVLMRGSDYILMLVIHWITMNEDLTGSLIFQTDTIIKLTHRIFHKVT